MFDVLHTYLAFARATVLSRSDLLVENAALRQQLKIYHRQSKPPRLLPSDRVFWIDMGDSGRLPGAEWGPNRRISISADYGGAAARYHLQGRGAHGMSHSQIGTIQLRFGTTGAGGDARRKVDRILVRCAGVTCMRVGTSR